MPLFFPNMAELVTLLFLAVILLCTFGAAIKKYVQQYLWDSKYSLERVNNIKHNLEQYQMQLKFASVFCFIFQIYLFIGMHV